MWLWTIVLLGVAGHCVARLVVAQRAHCAVDRTHNAIEAAMSAGMAAMVSPIGGPIPRAGWEAAFAVAVGWAAFSAGRSHSRRAWMWLRQAVAGGGMLYMLTTTEMPMSGTDMMQMSSAMVPAVTWTLVAYFGAVALWSRCCRPPAYESASAASPSPTGRRSEPHRSARGPSHSARPRWPPPWS
ncbi:DUF5134 domain-containing protein [Fodinicola feengrottensis]|uniref:DUF5134 domain-containing protein n=1 Tax=Fodinicola feengrottensis TaxID=435914 RepID=UPI0013CF8C4F|nr:DUF5134 domain-containing protein [Fodinicola feengrottensis]